MAAVEVFTDGSCFHNGKSFAYGGIGAFFGESDPRNVSVGFRSAPDGGRVTNQVMELLAIKASLQRIVGDVKVTIYSDSSYAIKCVTEWHRRWETNGWRSAANQPVQNQELIRDILTLCRAFVHTPRFVHVSAHLTQPRDKTSVAWTKWHGNDQAHHLATNAALSVKR
jgi:ribonuclease HI